jgi:hypothetical protein
VGSILTAGKQASKITADSPSGTKEEEKDNETKLIDKKQ